MFIYIFPVVYALTLAFISNKNRILDRILIAIICIFLITVISIKGEIDKDYVNYLYLFENSSKFQGNLSLKDLLANYTGLEIGFNILNRLIKTLELNVQYIYGFFSLSSAFFIYKICDNFKSANKLLVFLVLYVQTFLGLWVQIRYGLASLAIILALILYSQKKYKLFLILIAFSALFHSITFSIFLIIFFYKIVVKLKLNKTYIYLILLGLSPLLFIDLSKYIGNLLVIANARYIDYTENNEGSINSYFIRLLYFFILCSLSINPLKANTLKHRQIELILYSMSILSVIIFLFAFQVTILYRVGVICELGYLYFIMKTSYQSKENYIMAIGIIVIFLFYRISLSFNELDVYKTFF